jgi:hypothetical protein
MGRILSDPTSQRPVLKDTGAKKELFSILFLFTFKKKIENFWSKALTKSNT